MASVREINNNEDLKVGIRFPLGRSSDGFFHSTSTVLEQAKSNIRNLLLTSPGERVMQPDFGSRLKSLVFEPTSLSTFDAIEETIRESINRQLPYVIINDIIIDAKPDANMINISLEFSVSIEPDTFDTITFNFNIGD